MSPASALVPSTREEPWPVALMSQKLRDWIDRLGMVWIEGELTQWQVRGGNVYGKLKDLREDATVSLSVWNSVLSKLSGDFKQGDRVVALVKANFWVKGGSLTVQVHDLRHVGVGDLLERLERLRQQLRSEGLFGGSRKRALPFLPHRIGLITGKNSDAEQDVLRNATLRWPGVQFRVHYSAVQGDKAPAEVVAGIEALDRDPEVDVIIIARGGGDFQHLLTFSDERVVRAAAAAQTPIISAIGHEADRPLLDEVADLRASTPTDAAKRVVPDVGEELARIDQARSRMSTRLGQLVSHEVDRIAQLRGRPVLARPDRLIDERAEELGRWISRGTELAERTVRDAGSAVAELHARLTALSPQATLERGYAIAQLPDGQILQKPDQAPEGTLIRLSLAGGKMGVASLGESD